MKLSVFFVSTLLIVLALSGESEESILKTITKHVRNKVDKLFHSVGDAVATGYNKIAILVGAKGAPKPKQTERRNKKLRKKTTPRSKKGSRRYEKLFNATDQLLAKKLYTGMPANSSNEWHNFINDQTESKNMKSTSNTSFEMRTTAPAHPPYPIYFSDGSISQEVPKGKKRKHKQAKLVKHNKHSNKSGIQTQSATNTTSLSASFSQNNPKKNIPDERNVSLINNDLFNNGDKIEGGRLVGRKGSAEKSDFFNSNSDSAQISDSAKIGDSIERIGSAARDDSNKRGNSVERSSSVEESVMAEGSGSAEGSGTFESSDMADRSSSIEINNTFNKSNLYVSNELDNQNGSIPNGSNDKILERVLIGINHSKRQTTLRDRKGRNNINVKNINTVNNVKKSRKYKPNGKRIIKVLCRKPEELSKKNSVNKNRIAVKFRKS